MFCYCLQNMFCMFFVEGGGGGGVGRIGQVMKGEWWIGGGLLGVRPTSHLQMMKNDGHDGESCKHDNGDER